MNKCDSVPSDARFPKECVCISAKYGHGFDFLKQKIFQALMERFVVTQLFVPYARAGEYAALRPLLTEQSVQYTDDGAQIRAVIPTEHASKFRSFLVL